MKLQVITYLLTTHLFLLKMPAINTKFTTPSTYSNHDDQGGLFSFLSNKDFKHLYHKMMGSAERYAKRHARIWFLSQCIELKLIPKMQDIHNLQQSPIPG